MILANPSPMETGDAVGTFGPSRSARLTWLDAAVLCVILGAGLSHLGSPFSGDQFLYLDGARKILQHGVIYREFWDIKQPLIFYLYALAGKMFGLTERGIHVFEALYQTSFAGFLIAVYAARLRYRWAASIVPLMAIAPYYAFANNEVLASVEAFTAMPIFVAGFYAVEAFALRDGPVWKGITAGIAGAAVAALKLVYFPIVVALWLTAMALSRADGQRAKMRVVALLTLGCAAPLMLLATYFDFSGVLDVALRTAFVDPPAIVRRLASASHSPFWLEARAFVRGMWPLAVLAIIGIASARRRADVLTISMIVWTIGGCVLSALQVWSSYYKFFIVVAPLGVLATLGLESLRATAHIRGVRVKIVLASALVVMLVGEIREEFRVQADWRISSRENSRTAASNLSFLQRRGALPGAIYVFGDPETYYYSHRDQAIAINGWSPQLLLPRQWNELRDELAAAAPPYILIQSHYAPIVHNVPEIAQLLSSSYRAAAVSRDGTWYERR